MKKKKPFEKDERHVKGEQQQRGKKSYIIAFQYFPREHFIHSKLKCEPPSSVTEALLALTLYSKIHTVFTYKGQRSVDFRLVCPKLVTEF